MADIHPLYLQYFQQGPFSKILREKLQTQISNSNGHLTSFDVLIITHVICTTAELLVDRGLSGIVLEIFSKVHRSKYDSIIKYFHMTL